MSRQLIRAALEKHLNSLSPVWPTQWEGMKLTTPTGQPWQRATVMFADTKPMGIFADAPEEWSGYLHVAIFIPFGTGAQPAEARATLLAGNRVSGVQGHFYRGQVLIEGNAKLTINQPVIKSGQEEDEVWYMVPVHIPFVCYAG